MNRTANFTRGDGLLEAFLAKKRAKMANKLVPGALRSGRILDIGCGTIPFFLINTDFREKYGLDPSVNTSPSYDNINLFKFDIEHNNKFGFEDNFFDVITMLAVFEHLEPIKLPGTLKEIGRVIKPGGRFIVTTPAPWSDKLLRLMAGIKLVSAEEIDEHKGAYNHLAIADYFNKAGFKGDKMKFGYFELFLNVWAYVDK